MDNIEQLSVEIQDAISHNDIAATIEACRRYGKAISAVPGGLIIKGTAFSLSGGNVRFPVELSTSQSVADQQSLVLYNTANQCSLDGKMTMAFALWDAAYETNRDPSALNNKAAELRDIGRYDEAIQCFDRVINDRPDYPQACLRAALLLESYKPSSAMFSSSQYLTMFVNRGGDFPTAQMLLNPDARKEPERTSAIQLLSWLNALTFSGPSQATSVSEQSDTSSPATKVCPYCAEKILAAAIKCKHCGSMLPVAAPPPCHTGFGVPQGPPSYPSGAFGQSSYSQPGKQTPDQIRPVKRTAKHADTALMLSIFSIFCCGLLTGIPALILASKAREEIRQDPTLDGKSTADAAIAITWIGIALNVLGFLIICVGESCG
jgi:hypothetical protein